LIAALHATVAQLNSNKYYRCYIFTLYRKQI